MLIASTLVSKFTVSCHIFKFIQTIFCIVNYIINMNGLQIFYMLTRIFALSYSYQIMLKINTKKAKHIRKKTVNFIKIML